MVYKENSFGLYYNDWATYAEQVANYLNEIITCSVNINSTIHRVQKKANFSTEYFHVLYAFISYLYI